MRLTGTMLGGVTVVTFLCAGSALAGDPVADGGGTADSDALTTKIVLSDGELCVAEDAAAAEFVGDLDANQLAAKVAELEALFDEVTLSDCGNYLYMWLYSEECLEAPALASPIEGDGTKDVLPPRSRHLFVGGLSWGTDDSSLRNAFEQFGEVTDAKVVTDRETGRSRGFGFVTFSDGSSADDAMTGMEGSALDGRSIRVNEASERSGGGRGGGGGGGFRCRR